MTYVIIALILILVGALVLHLQRPSRYYDAIFSDEHFIEIAGWLREVLQLGAIDDPEEENRTVFQTSGHCGLTYTRAIGTTDTIHIAMSQVGRPTTHAVTHRIALLVIELLAPNAPKIDFFSTESAVHHLLLQKPVGDEWITEDIEIAMEDFKSNEPPSCRREAIKNNV